jgi:hypothetical protein
VGVGESNDSPGSIKAEKGALTLAHTNQQESPSKLTHPILGN